MTASAGSPVTVHGPDGAVTGQRRTALAGGSGWLPVIPAVVTLVVMLYHIQRPSFWRDEGATLAAVHRSLPQMFRMLGTQDAVHGAYYLLIWFWVRLFGSGELALRLPSAAAMAVAAAFIALLGRRLVSPGAGLAAGLVFAALPSVSRYGQEARSYALVAALATVASYLFVRVLDAEPATRRRWLTGYGVALAGLGLANIFGLLLIPAHLPLLLLRLRAAGQPASSGEQGPAGAARGLLRGWLAAVVAAGVVVSPVIVLTWSQRNEVRWIKPVSLKEIGSLTGLAGGFRPTLVMLVIIACAVVASAIRGRARRQADWPAALVALAVPWLLLPAALLLAGSLIHPSYTFRYIVFCIPAAALLAGVALAALGRWLGVVGLILIVLAGLPGQQHARAVSGHSENLRQLSHLLARHAQPGDAVIFAGRNDREFEAAYPAGYRGLRDVALGRTAVSAGRLLATDAPTPVVRSRLSTVTRLWGVETGADRGNVPVLSGLGFRQVRRWDVSGIWLVLYTRP
ncbi:MAG TPA: glycosyltransferase family 39 protein [Streptosporangiaceae bacterium]|nr:glycosyltransferase family 39 protein [Streptosporangiaceae bacterium]